jgi:fucose permease
MKRSFAAMALSGIATTMLGPLLPGLTARGGWTDAQSGVLFFAQFAASVVLAAAAGPLAVRCGYRPLIAVGLLMIAVACAGCAIAPPAMLALCVSLNGCGLGLLIPAANWTAAQMNPGKSAASVMWMNLSWSVGSVVAPLAIQALGAGFLWTLGGAALLMAPVLAMGAPPPAPVQRTAPPSGIRSLTVIAAALLFLYSGSESALGGWLSTYARRMPGAEGLWAVLPSIFWSGILFGRTAAPAVLTRITTRRLVVTSMMGAFAAVLLLVLGKGAAPILGAAALAGVSMAPIFPLVVAQYADRTGGGAASGLVFAASGLGGAAIPPLVGIVGDASGSLRTGVAVLLAWIAGMIALEQRL